MACWNYPEEGCMSTLHKINASLLIEESIGICLAIFLAWAALYIIGPFSYMYFQLFPRVILSELLPTRILLWNILENVPDYLLSFFLASTMAFYYRKLRRMDDSIPIIVFILMSLLLKCFILFRIYASGINSLSERYLVIGEVSAKLLSVCFAYLAWSLWKAKNKESKVTF